MSSSLSANSRACKLTITSLSKRSVFIESQLASTALFMLQLVKRLFKPKTGKTPREAAIVLRQDTDAYMLFYNSICSQFPNFAVLARLAAQTTVDVCKLHDYAQLTSAGEYVAEPVHVLWLMLLELVYSSPFILDDDDNRGTAVGVVRDALTKDYPSRMVTIADPLRKLSVPRTGTNAPTTTPPMEEEEKQPPQPPKGRKTWPPPSEPEPNFADYLRQHTTTNPTPRLL